MTFHTHCALRLGDNLIHLNFLRRLARRYPEHNFVHGAHLCYINQLSEVIWDLSNIRLIPIEYKDPASIDVWKNAGGWWETHLLKNDFAKFHICFFRMIAEKMELESPIYAPSDLLFEYPAIQKTQKICEPFECLIINSPPQSNQWRRYNEQELTALIAVLSRRMPVITTHRCRLEVACTDDPKLQHSVTTIGTLSLHCKYIVMVSTGPSWPTFNIWNTESVKRRIVLIDSEEVNIAPNTVHCKTTNDARKMLELEGII